MQFILKKKSVAGLLIVTTCLSIAASGCGTNPAAKKAGPSGGLQAHEAAGGHTLARHVGRTEAQLAQRLVDEPTIRAASSFYDRASAETAVAEAITAEQSQIDRWLAGGQNRYVFTRELAHNAGISLRRGEARAEDIDRVRIVLERDPAMPMGYHIVTAYPD